MAPLPVNDGTVEKREFTTLGAVESSRKALDEDLIDVSNRVDYSERLRVILGTMLLDLERSFK